MAELWNGEVGDRCRARLQAAGLKKKKRPTVEDIEKVCYTSRARIFRLTPHDDSTHHVGEHHRHPRYEWTMSDGPDADGVAASA